MKTHTANNQKKKHQIEAVEVTSDCLTSRAGLVPCVAYMNQIGIFTKIERTFTDSSGDAILNCSFLSYVSAFPIKCHRCRRRPYSLQLRRQRRAHFRNPSFGQTRCMYHPSDKTVRYNYDRNSSLQSYTHRIARTANT
jgi:hypothetical protein